ncbi:MAG TPA: Rieske 2Fe-2S domain-containing protein, partial [Planctomycetaceae bacterium]|nr:Rieske 2Fe-2S domain-containing protein [Planctomycetaceae bacterium]
MSGCPSSCAQHFTADIGLKGVRVRRMIGTREGFDVYLGGGLSGQVHMGLLYKLGVDADQLPNLIEEVTSEFYLKHKSGQTFSAYWREKLQSIEASKVEDEEYQLPLWICEGCEYEHSGEDPPVFCPSCAGLRRLFARVDTEESGSEVFEKQSDARPTRIDGFSYAARLDDIPESEGLTVTIGGTEYALFRHEDGVKCIDSACPHEGASLADGEIKDGVVTCPWHQWTFNVCNGCSLDPPGNDVRAYETKIDDGNVFAKVESQQTDNDSTIDRSLAATLVKPVKKPPRPVEAVLTITEIIDETHDVKTFRLTDRGGMIPFDLPGKFVKVCLPVDGEEIWRSFTISSSPTTKGQIDLTIKRNPAGQLTSALFDTIQPGNSLKLKGAQGGFYLDPDLHPEPLVLISAGSGITPMMSISRFLKGNQSERPVLFLHGARTDADIIFYDECRMLAKECSWFRYFVTLSQPSDAWSGATGRLSMAQLHSLLENRL